MSKEKIHKNFRNIFKDPKDTELLFNTKIKGDSPKRRKRFKKQKEEYGFDERETWNLNFTTITWLYSHLERLLEWNTVVDYYNTSHIYTIPVIIKEKGEYQYKVVEDEDGYFDLIFKTEDKKLPIGSIVEIILEYFEYYLRDDSWNFTEEYAMASELAKHGIKLYAEIFQSLWW